MATEYGFIYVLGNESMPGIYKIGFTMGHPKARMEQLSSATACPTPFYLLACFGVENPRQVEQEIHRILAKSRVNSSREFFKCDLVSLNMVAQRFIDEDEVLYHTTDLEDAANEQWYEQDQQWKLNHFLSQCADPIHWPSRYFDDIPF